MRESMKREKNDGFTLIELMLVVTVLSIVMALALPGFTNSRKYANETSAVSSLRTLSTAQFQYRTRYGSFGQVSELTTGGYVDNNFADGEKSGYRFTSSGTTDAATWAISAEPVDPGVTGDRWFFVDTSGVIRFRDGSAAGATDPAID